MTGMRVLGLMSGTSVDGVDAAVAELTAAGDTLQLTRIGELTLPWPAGLRERVVGAQARGSRGEAGSPAVVARLDRDLGAALGNIAAEALTRLGPVALIASHGQTVSHEVTADRRVRSTLQLGSPAELAERTGLPVVADFRVRDVAAGGQGAPLVSMLDELLLAGVAATAAGPVAALNLGGIANLTVVRPGAPTVAFDCGPGNALLDAAAARATGHSYDAAGRLTARGAVDPALLAVLCDDPYLAAPPPKSTGKERYHAGYLDAALAAAPVAAAEDLLATLAAFTAAAVAGDAARYQVRRVYASGGGVHNAGLMSALRQRLGEARAELTTTDELGMPPDAKEAYAFAVLGWLTWHGLAGNVPSCTGAAGARVLGTLTPGAGPLRLPVPLPAAPRRVALSP